MKSTLTTPTGTIQLLFGLLALLLLCSGCAQNLQEIDQQVAQAQKEIYSFGILTSDLEPVLHSSSKTDAFFTIINNGRFSFMNEMASFRLCYYWAVPTGELVVDRDPSNGVDLPELLAQRELSEHQLEIFTPGLAGRYYLILDLWIDPHNPEEEGYWMSDRHGEAPRILLEVTHE